MFIRSTLCLDSGSLSAILTTTQGSKQLRYTVTGVADIDEAVNKLSIELDTPINIIASVDNRASVYYDFDYAPNN